MDTEKQQPSRLKPELYRFDVCALYRNMRTCGFEPYFTCVEDPQGTCNEDSPRCVRGERLMKTLNAILKITTSGIVCGVVLLCVAGQSWATTAEEGQAIFDGVFWHILACFVMGLSAGLAIKLINRS